MDEIERIQLLAQLASGEEFCELNHGPNTKRNDFPACNYITLPIGHKKDPVQETAVRELVIPVCYECSIALIQELWTLLYCLDCGDSRWVYRELAKNNYRHHILWVKGCPDCTNEFGGLYFNDQPTMSEKVSFLWKLQ